jgi:hypothetical protein
MFSTTDLNKMFQTTLYRKNEMMSDIAQSHVPNVLHDIKKVLNSESIKDRLMQKCKTFVHPKDLNIGIYGYNKNKIVHTDGLTVRLSHVIESTDLLFQLLDMFGHGQFRLTTRTMDGLDGWKEILLHYYPGGVPLKLRQLDPMMPPLDAPGPADMHQEPLLPPSPIPMNPEDSECNYPGCYCQN